MRTAIAVVIAAAALLAGAHAQQPQQPQFANGLAQPVFEGQTIIRHNVWVEIPGLDSDRDGGGANGDLARRCARAAGIADVWKRDAGA